jgi:hypothetical protein
MQNILPQWRITSFCLTYVRTRLSLGNAKGRIENMSVDCSHCRDLKQIALTASKVYHEVLEYLEAAHIHRDVEAQLLLAARLERALRRRDAAIADLTNHEATHSGKEPVEGLRLSKRQSA